MALLALTRWSAPVLALSVGLAPIATAESSTARPADEPTPLVEARSALASTADAHGARSAEVIEARTALVEALLDANRGAEALLESERVLEAVESVHGSDHARVADAAMLVGRAARVAIDIEREVSAFEMAVDVREVAHGPDHPATADALEALGRALISSRGAEAARPHLDRVLVIRLAHFGEGSVEVADAQMSLSGALRDLDANLAATSAALETYRRVLGAEHAKTAEASSGMALSLERLDRLEDALEPIEEAVAITERLDGPNASSLGAPLNVQYRILSKLGRLDEAIAAAERALGVVESHHGPNSPRRAPHLRNLAMANAHRGDFARARALLEEDIALRLTVIPPDHPTFFYAHGTMAWVELNLGDAHAALEHATRGLEILEARGAHDPLNVAAIRSNLADAHHLAERHDRALEEIRAAIAILDEAGLAEHPFRADLVADLARMTAAAGLDEESLEAWNAAIAVREADETPRSTFPVMLAGRGAVLARLGRLDHARRDLERALAAWAALDARPHLDQATAMVTLAGVRRDAGADPSVVLDLALRAEALAREHFTLLADGLAPREALEIEAARASGLDLALTVLLESSDSLGGDAIARTWDQVERSRALVLDAAARRARLASRAETPELRTLVNRLANASRRAATLALSGPSGDPGQHARLLDAALEERESAERQLAAATRGVARAEPVGLDEIRPALPAGHALVAHVRFDRVARTAPGIARSKNDAAAPAHAAFVLARRDAAPIVVDLGDAAHVDELVSSWHRDAGTRPSALLSAGRAAEARALRSGDALRAAAWDPVERHLDDATMILIVPDGALHLVNWSTLPLAGAEASGADGVEAGSTPAYLIEGPRGVHRITTARSVVHHARRERAPGHGVLVLGAPDFDAIPAPDSAVVRAEESAIASNAVATSTVAGLLLRSSDPECVSSGTREFAQLPGSAIEVASVAEAWREALGEEPVLLVSGRRASPAELVRHAPGRRVVHLATHGFYERPACGDSDELASWPLLRSGLALAGANAGASGIITAEELAAVDFSAAGWVVLSACETGLGDVRVGEGVLGLHRALETAGAGTLVLSLWPVDDDATRRWMKVLHSERARGASTPESVTAATRARLAELRAVGQPTHPFSWGAFVAVGDWR